MDLNTKQSILPGRTCKRTWECILQFSKGNWFICSVVKTVISLQETDIDYMFNNSDLEDFLPNDEDCDDPSFLLSKVQLSSVSDSGSDSETNESNVYTSNRASGSDRNFARETPQRERVNLKNGSPVNPSQESSKSTTWVEKNFISKELRLLEPSYLECSSEHLDNPLSYFQQYVDDELVNLIAEKTNKSSILNGGHSLNVSKEELYIYIGITFIMASLNFPFIRMYWEKRWRVAVVADHMARNRFTQIRNSIKFVFDSDVTQLTRDKDKLWKVRPLIDKIRKGCLSQRKSDHMSVDEMIIPFTGACGIKQYCPGKPNPVGLKAFVLANLNGLVCDFHVYQGSTTYPDYENSRLGAGEKAVLTLADNLVPGHTLYFDQYFTSEKLADELNKRGIGCTGTLMKNRIPIAARSIIKDDKELKTEGRGSSHVIVREDDQLVVTKWFDNKPVVMLSTVEAKDNVDYCQRWCKRNRYYVPVERPRVVREYNSNMGGVDLADRLLSVCPYRYRTKKWTQRFFAHMLDLAVSNSWVQYKNDQVNKNVPVKKIQQLRWFKMELGENLIDTSLDKLTQNSDSIKIEREDIETTNTMRRRGKPTTALPSKKSRLKEAKHMPISVDKQGRCRHCHYKKTKIKCNSCNILLCLTNKRNCYLDFHA